MKVGITGSRNLTNKGLIEFILKSSLNYILFTPTVLVHGGAEGVDKISEEIMLQIYSNIEIIIHRPKYHLYDEWNKKQAPKDRNTTIVNESDIMIGIYNNYENIHTGTIDACKKALKSGKDLIFTHVVNGRTTVYSGGYKRI